MQLSMYDSEGKSSVFKCGAGSATSGTGFGKPPARTVQHKEKEEQECGKHDEVSGKS